MQGVCAWLGGAILPHNMSINGSLVSPHDNRVVHLFSLFDDEDDY